MLRWLAIAATCAACSSRDRPPIEHTQANGFNDPGLRISLCGTVTGFTPPSPDGDGTLILDAGAWRVARGARLRGAELLERGTDVCLAATLDPDRRILDGDVTEAPDGDPWARLPP